MCVDDLFSCVCRGFLGEQEDLQLCAQRTAAKCVAWELKGSAAECVDQNCGFCKELNKT